MAMVTAKSVCVYGVDRASILLNLTSIVQNSSDRIICQFEVSEMGSYLRMESTRLTRLSKPGVEFTARFFQGCSIGKLSSSRLVGTLDTQTGIGDDLQAFQINFVSTAAAYVIFAPGNSLQCQADFLEFLA